MVRHVAAITCVHITCGHRYNRVVAFGLTGILTIVVDILYTVAAVKLWRKSAPHSASILRKVRKISTILWHAAQNLVFPGDAGHDFHLGQIQPVLAARLDSFHLEDASVRPDSNVSPTPTLKQP